MSTAKDIADRLELTLDNAIEHSAIHYTPDASAEPMIVLSVQDWSQLIVDASRAVGYMGAES